MLAILAPVILNAVSYLYALENGGWGVQMVADVTVDGGQNTGAVAVLKAKPITATQWQTLRTLDIGTGSGQLVISGGYGEHPGGSVHDVLLRVTNNVGGQYSTALGQITIPEDS